jgi:hypothetical protein
MADVIVIQLPNNYKFIVVKLVGARRISTPDARRCRSLMDRVYMPVLPSADGFGTER